MRQGVTLAPEHDRSCRLSPTLFFGFCAKVPRRHAFPVWHPAISKLDFRTAIFPVRHLSETRHRECAPVARPAAKNATADLPRCRIRLRFVELNRVSKERCPEGGFGVHAFYQAGWPNSTTIFGQRRIATEARRARRIRPKLAKCPSTKQWFSRFHRPGIRGRQGSTGISRFGSGCGRIVL